MDFLERLTDTFLEAQGIRLIPFEPRDLATPPDFGIANKLAIECTQLIKEINGCDITGKIHPTMASLEQAITSVEFGSQNRGYYISVEYVLEGKTKARHRDNICKLKEKLKMLRDQELVSGAHFKVSDDLEIQIGPSSSSVKTQFHLDSFNCEASSGWVVPDLLEQCQAALAKKKSKMEGIANEYQEWWLAVGSSLTIGLDDSALTFLRENLHGEGFWNRIVLIDAHDPSRSRVIKF